MQYARMQYEHTWRGSNNRRTYMTQSAVNSAQLISHEVQHDAMHK